MFYVSKGRMEKLFLTALNIIYYEREDYISNSTIKF